MHSELTSGRACPHGSGRLPGRADFGRFYYNCTTRSEMFLLLCIRQKITCIEGCPYIRTYLHCARVSFTISLSLSLSLSLPPLSFHHCISHRFQQLIPASMETKTAATYALAATGAAAVVAGIVMSRKGQTDVASLERSLLPVVCLSFLCFMLFIAHAFCLQNCTEF